MNATTKMTSTITVAKTKATINEGRGNARTFQNLSKTKSLRKLVRSARYAMEKRADQKAPAHHTTRHSQQPCASTFRRSVDNVVEPPPSGGVVLSSDAGVSPSKPACTSLLARGMSQQYQPRDDSGSMSSISNVSDAKITWNYNNSSSLSSISDVSSVKPRKADGRAMTNISAVSEEDSLSSLHDFQNSFSSSVSDLTASQDLNASRNSVNSLASITAGGPQARADHFRKLGSSVRLSKQTSLRQLEEEPPNHSFVTHGSGSDSFHGNDYSRSTAEDSFVSSRVIAQATKGTRAV